MSAPIRLRVTWVSDYPADPEHYPDCDGDPVKMAAYDYKPADDGADFFGDDAA